MKPTIDLIGFIGTTEVIMSSYKALPGGYFAIMCKVVHSVPLDVTTARQTVASLLRRMVPSYPKHMGAFDVYGIVHSGPGRNWTE